MNNHPLLEDLRIYCSVIRTGAFITVAREQGLSKAVISKRINVLEETLQTKLLHRTTRRLTVTEQGKIVHQWAQRILEDVDLMAEAITTYRVEPTGLLRLCTSSGFGRNQVAPALSALAFRYPKLDIQLELIDRPVDLIGEGFQLDIRVGAVREPNLISHRIANNIRVLCAAPSYLERWGMPTSLKALEEHRCVVIRERDQDFGRWTLKGPKGMETVKINGPLSANNGEIVHCWAKDGHGIILRSIWDVGPSIERGELVRVLPEYAQEADVSAVYPSRLANSAKVRVCVEFLEDWFKPAGMEFQNNVPLKV